MVQRFIRRSGEFELNTQTRNGQAAPSLAATSNGGFIAVWSDGSGIGGDLFDTGIKGQRFDSAGNKIGAEFLVNTTTRQIQNASHVTVLSSGKFVVTWTDLQVVDNGVISDIRGRLFNADGTPAGNEFVVNTAPSKSGGSDVVALSGGGFVVTWADGSQQGGDANGQAIHGQVFSAAGARVGAEFVANTTTAGSQVAPTIGALASGGFVISWGDSSQTGGDTSLSAIRLQMFSALGAKVGTEKLVNTVTDQAQTLPSITTLKSGGFAVFWTDASKLADTSGTGIKGQLYDSAGAKVGGEFLVNTVTDGDQRRARASGLPDGGFIVTWESSTASASGVDIKAQIFDATGKKVGTEFFVESSTIGNQSGQHVVTLSSGDIVLAWGDSVQTGADSSSSAIRARIIGAGSAVPSDIALSNALVSETSAA
ncbi:MAG TPA: hypothetical protein VGX37_13120, partial [Allosphingosinicella sp.]|nr:hypothetical protein [Allosphingosinicella sp.]